MARRYFVDELPEPGPATVRGEVAHHLAHVLRCAPGDPVVLADGNGHQCHAVVQRCGRDGVELIADAVVLVPRAAPPLHVAFAPPKWTRAEWLFEHGTEVGIDVFWPLWTERTRPQPGRADRWDRQVRAAAGQCDRAWLPKVHGPIALADFVAAKDVPPLRFLAAAGAPPPPPRLPDAAALLVGPEGGLTEQEQQQAIAAGFQPIGLGPHVLRTETAALVGAALLRAAMQAAR